MLLGREAEVARINEAIDQAGDGRSTSLVVSGEAGVGKTALLKHVAGTTQDVVTLTARGVESESDIAFSGLADVLRPVTHHIEKLPAVQSAALSGALALGPAVPGDRFTVSAAFLAILAAAAEEQPALVIVDDAQWLDPPSAESILFAARRLGEERIVLVFAYREGEDIQDPGADLEQLRLSGLAPDDALLLLRHASEGEIDPKVARLLVDATYGNPLALVELPRLLDPDQLAGRTPMEEPLPVGPNLERALLRRIQRLPDQTQDALLIAASSDTGAMEEIAPALKSRQLDETALEPAEEQRVLAITEGVAEFVHPMLRSAIYHAAPMPHRRRAHAALAEAISRPERRAWHRASAISVPDEEVAAELEAAAQNARVRSGYAAAAAAYEKAARLTPDEHERARRLLEAASSAHDAGMHAHALEMLSEALAYSSDPLLRAELQHLTGTVQQVAGSPHQAADLLWREAEAVASRAPDKAALMLASAAISFHFSGRVDRGVEAARRAYESAETEPPRALAGLLYGLGLVLDGKADEGWSLVERYLPALPQFPQPQGWLLQTRIGQVCYWVERVDLAEELVGEGISALRGAGAPSFLPWGLAVACEIHYRTGEWERAYAEGLDGIRLATETGQPIAGANLITTGRIEALRGHFDDAIASAQQTIDITRRSGTYSLLGYARSVLGLVELTRGSPTKAVVELKAARDALKEHGMHNPNVVHCLPDLIGAYVASGAKVEARGVLEEFDEMVSRTPSNYGLATLARCRGLVDDDLTYLEEALALHDRSLNPFERARTLYFFGEKFRRSGHPSDARPPLREAIAVFERLGATPWAERARKGLTATGERTRSKRIAAPAQLTPQELQVALAITGGATNREAASALFLSPKTIEYHLSHIYSKLGLRSRSELAAHMATMRASQEH
ncbi:MAG: AAA family ATPase [Actinomycetota bacterium]